MKSLHQKFSLLALYISLWLTATATAQAQGDDRLVGVWTVDEGFQIVELLFRSDGRYQMHTRSTDPFLDFSSTEQGRYEVSGESLILVPYDYFAEPQSKPFHYQVDGGSLTLHTLEFPLSLVYQFKAGSRADVLARENAIHDLTGAWKRSIQFFGTVEYRFRPGGYYTLTNTPEDGQFPPEIIRGRYYRSGERLTLHPYSGVAAEYEIDFFGNTLTLISDDGTFGEAAAFENIPGSATMVRAKAAEAEAFLARENWQAGVWEIRDPIQRVDLTLRPDGHYIAREETEFLQGTIRGRYSLEPGRIRLFPFVGQGLYARSNGEFGKVERTRELDYYDGELQFIDLEAISQSVTLARKRPGSEAVVMEKSRQAEMERQQSGWHLGIWEVNDPAGWMEFTFRPDGRYIAKAGVDRTPYEVERGRYLVGDNKITLEPYAGLGASRGFELDLYDGDLFLIGDLNRMVVARKVPGSDVEVTEKTLHPIAMRGERGSILGLWTANLPGQSSELVFRQDGQFRLTRCAFDTISHDYGLYRADMTTRGLVSDSRFRAVQTLGLDFYGETMTLFGGHLGPPSSYVVNLGTVDAAIEASFADDAEEAEIDAQWLARVPIGPRSPNAVQIPTAEIPADPNPGRIFDSPTVFTQYRLYRRLSPSFVYFNHLGTIKSVAVVNTREWHFFPTGRLLVRFRTYRAGVIYPTTVVDVSDSWGAYRIEPKPAQRDILRLYADNSLFIESDSGEQVEMTLEDGRRHLFWGKDYMILSEWAAEQKSIPCQPPADADGSLMNTGVSLSTQITPDEIVDSRPIQIRLAGPESGHFTVSGTAEVGGPLVIERTTSLAPPVVWEAWQTNIVEAGPFGFLIPQGTGPTGYFRVREL